MTFDAEEALKWINYNHTLIDCYCDIYRAIKHAPAYSHIGCWDTRTNTLILSNKGTQQ